MTGWPPGMLQDDCKALSKWLATCPGAMHQLKQQYKEQAMKRSFELSPGIAALLHVRELTEEVVRAAIFLSVEKGVVVGNKPLAEMPWPLQLRAEINKHFGTVFALRHEDWNERGQSPRAQYLEQLQPWILEINEP